MHNKGLNSERPKLMVPNVGVAGPELDVSRWFQCLKKIGMLPVCFMSFSIDFGKVNSSYITKQDFKSIFCLISFTLRWFTLWPDRFPAQNHYSSLAFGGKLILFPNKLCLINILRSKPCCPGCYYCNFHRITNRFSTSYSDKDVKLKV